MKLLIALAAIAICLPLTSMLPSAGSSITMPEAPRLEGTWFEGTIASCMVGEDGTVSVQLLANNEPKWFRTPANQSSTTQFELLTLNAVLALESHAKANTPPTVRIHGEATTERDGKTVKHAMRLLAIGRG